MNFKEKIITENGNYKASDEDLKGYHKLLVDVHETTGLPAEIQNEVLELQPLEEVCDVSEGIQHIFPNPFVDSYNASKSQAYLQSTGTQYIDSGVCGQTGMKVEMRVQLDKASTDSVLFGYSGTTRFYPFYITSNTFQWGYGNQWASTTKTTDTNTIYTLIFNTSDTQQTLHINDDVIWSDSISGNYTTENNCFIFAGNSPSGVNWFTYMKLYYCKIWDTNGVLIRDFIPTLDQDNTACLYDNITQTYFYNQGTGNFIFNQSYDTTVSANVNDIIAPITNLTHIDAQFNYQWQRGDNPQIYLETIGDGAYINTNILPNQDYKVEMLFRHMNNVNSYEIPFGSRTSSTSNCFAYFQKTNNVMTSKTLSYNNGETVITNMPTFYKVVTKLTMDGNYLELQSDDEYKDIARPYGTFTCSVPLTIFGCNTNGTVQYFTPMQLFYFKIWNELDELVADYVPVLSPEEGHSNEPCLYDNISQTYFYNAGTSNFTIGYESLNYTNIEGETNNTYTATEDDINKCIKCKLSGIGNCKDQNLESFNVLIIEGDVD